MSTINGSNDPSVKDKLVGTIGDDYIYAMAGNDQVKAGYGDDQVLAGEGLDTVYGGFGSDYIFGEGGADKLYGESGNDYIFGGGGKDLLDGGSGDDRLTVGTVAEMSGDTVKGGDGIDWLVADYSSMAKVTFNAKDSLELNTVAGGFSVIDVERYDITGTAGNDVMSGWRHDDWFKAGGGADNLSGGGGLDTLNGGEGADTLNGDGGDDYLYTGDYNKAANDSALGGAGDDYIYADEGNDTLKGENGNDYIQAFEDNDSVLGGAGDDDLYGGTGADYIDGGSGDDFMASDHYSFTVDGADNTLEKDTLIGGVGNDSAAIGVGDEADGGADFDVIRLAFRNSAQGVTFTLTDQAFTLQNGTKFVGFEIMEFQGGTGKDQVTGASFDDTLSGGGGDDVLNGAGGNDDLDGEDGDDRLTGENGDDYITDNGTGNDTVFAGKGNDTIYGGSGADSFNGDEGDDLIRLGDDFVGDKVNGGADFDTVDFYPANTSAYVDLMKEADNNGSAIGDSFKGIELFIGSYYDDVFLGNDATNWLQGSAGDDVLNGRAGDDWLDGGTGSDDLTGGAGEDVFVLDNGYSFLGTQWPADHIRDFTRGSDVLQVSLSEFDFATEADFRIVNAADPQPADGMPTFLYETDTHRLWFDEDGNGEVGEPWLIATLDNVAQLDVNDFYFVA